jgi:hypothetical protein
VPFINDQSGNLVYAQSLVPAHSPSEFGLDLRVMDINFDGRADIVTSGQKYVYGIDTSDQITASVLIANPDGTFAKRSVADAGLNAQCKSQQSSNSQTGLYLLKSADRSSYTVVSFHADASGTTEMYGRRVAASAPLTLQ